MDLKADGKDILQLQFEEIDDFHPDQIFRQVSIFSDLRDIRRHLLNPDTFDRAANEVRSWLDSADENITAESEEQTEAVESPPIGTNNLLDVILTQPTSSTASTKPQISDNSELSRFVSKIVTSSLVKIDEDEQTKLTSVVDEAISGLMRLILQHPKFKALESAWRGLHFLVRRIESDVNLKFLFSIFPKMK